MKSFWSILISPVFYNVFSAEATMKFIHFKYASEGMRSSRKDGDFAL
jgi:hypothetical protein